MESIHSQTEREIQIVMKTQSHKGILVYLYWKAGLSLAKIANHFGITRGQVWFDFLRYNIPRRTRTEAMKLGAHKWTEEEKQQISERLRGKRQSEEHIQKRVNSRKGYRHTEATKKKMSESLMGIRPSERTKKKQREAKLRNPTKYWSGKERSEETKKKISDANIGAIPWNKGIIWHGMRGKNNSQWKGGISTEPYPFEFDRDLKDRIRARDGHMCRVCELSEKKQMRRLCIHHIDGNKDNISEDNLVALCDSCHMSIHQTAIKLRNACHV